MTLKVENKTMVSKKLKWGHTTHYIIFIYFALHWCIKCIKGHKILLQKHGDQFTSSRHSVTLWGQITDIQGECSMPSEFLCYVVLNNYYTVFTVTQKHQFLFHIKAGVKTCDFLQSYMPTNAVIIFLYFFLHPMPYPIPSFLNMPVLHYKVFTKAIYNQTSNWLLSG